MDKPRTKTRLIADALYAAIQWEESLADANRGCDQAQQVRSLARAAEYRAELERRGYREPSVSGTPVNIRDLIREGVSRG